jgi:crossover junction endodeoxyribonuclease RuvC
MSGVIGIDPGLSGAIAHYFNGVITTYDMPTFAVTKGKKIRREVDAVQMATIIASHQPEHLILEQVGAMPGQGVTSMFNFGRSYGAVEGVVGALRIPLTRVTPQRWKSAMHLSADKGESRRRATQLFPDYADQWTRVKDDGRAEAALLAFYLAKGFDQ